MKYFLTAILFITVQFSVAQDDQFGSWGIVSLKYKPDQKWNLLIESQTRSQLFFNHFFYYEIKGGIGYSLNKNFSLFLGTGRYATYAGEGNFRKPYSNEEFRTWQQLNINHNLGRLKFEHRYRVEQRWFAKDGYRNRFRYRLSSLFPLNNKKLESKTFYVTAYNEIFLTNTTPYFQRNRVFGGFGYKFNDMFVLQPGYLYQFDYFPDNTKRGKGYLQVALTIDLQMKNDFHKNS